MKQRNIWFSLLSVPSQLIHSTSSVLGVPTKNQLIHLQPSVLGVPTKNRHEVSIKKFYPLCDSWLIAFSPRMTKHMGVKT